MITSTRIVVYTFLNNFIGGIKMKCKGKYQLAGGMHIKLTAIIYLRFSKEPPWGVWSIKTNAVFSLLVFGY